VALGRCRRTPYSCCCRGEKQRVAACAAAEQQRFDAIIAQRDRAATAIASSAANVDSVRAAAFDAVQRFDLERQRLAAERERAIAEKQALEAAKAAEFEKLRADCRKEMEKRLEAEKQLKIVSQASNTFSPSLLSPPPAHTPVDFGFRSPVSLPPRSVTPPVFPYRWVPACVHTACQLCIHACSPCVRH